MSDRAAPVVTRGWPQRTSAAMAGRAAMVGPGKGVASSGGAAINPRLLLGAISTAIGTGNLRMCQDAGDVNSYAGDQQWLDVSGEGNHMLLGTSSNAGADDPTFNGSFGGISANEYWSFDGGDVFQMAGANPTVIESAHKDGSKYTLLWIVNIVSFASPTSAVSLCGDYVSGTSNVGFLINIGTTSATGTLGIAVGNGSSTILAPRSTTCVLSLGWNICGLSVNENGGATASKWWCNKTNESFNASLTSPSAGSAAGAFALGDCQAASAGQRMNANQRLAGFAAFDTNLTTTQLDAIYDAIKPRFSGMP